MRDPRLDPQPGDVLCATSPTGKQLFRTVTGRKGGDIYYTSGVTIAGKTKVKNCWISTWMDWASKAQVKVHHLQPGEAPIKDNT